MKNIKIINIFGLIIIGIVLLSEISFSQWTYGNAFSLNPANSSLNRVSNKQPKTFMYDSLKFPYPTNKWFMNLILPNGSYGTTEWHPEITGKFGVYVQPYCVGFGYDYPIAPAPSPLKLIKIDYAPYDVKAQGSDSASVTWRNSFTMFMGTLDSLKIKPFLLKYDDFSATIRWRDTIDKNKGFMEAPLVRGMPYVSMYYKNFRPFVSISSPNLVSVNGLNVLGVKDTQKLTGTKFVLLLNGNPDTLNRAVWIMYSSTPAKFVFTYKGVQLMDSSFTGYIRLAYVTTRDRDPNAKDVDQRTNLLDKYSAFIPLGGKYEATVGDDPQKAEVKFRFETNNITNDSLLMLTLPHHKNQIKNNKSDLLKFQCLKGQMSEVHGKIWNIDETLTTIAWYSPATIANIPKIYTDVIYKYLKMDYDSLCGTRLFPYVPNGTNQLSNDVYGFGKTSAKLARLAVIADELADKYSDCKDIAKGIRDTLKYNINAWLNGRANPVILGANKPDSLLYDTKFGGIISSLSYDNGYYDDFGNAFYNDHHLQYGYWIYTAAVIARKDQSWVNAYGSKIVDIIRDIANPSYNDPYFPPTRMKDWYDGNSWANGMYDAGAGRNQESSSEAVNAWYGTYLYGLATQNKDIENTGKLLLVTEIKAAKQYYHISDDNPIYASIYTDSWKIVGNLWNALITNSTFFGKVPRYVYGIQVIPATPITFELWDEAYAKTVYSVLKNDVVFDSNSNTAVKTWTTICFPIQALADPEAAMKLFSTYAWFNGNFDAGASKTNTLYWILSQKYKVPAISLNEKTTKQEPKLHQNYPNPFNSSALIKFDIPSTQKVKIVIFDILGREVMTLVDKIMEKGSYSVNMNASNLSSGIYFYNLVTNKAKISKRMILLK